MQEVSKELQKRLLALLDKTSDGVAAGIEKLPEVAGDFINYIIYKEVVNIGAILIAVLIATMLCVICFLKEKKEPNEGWIAGSIVCGLIALVMLLCGVGDSVRTMIHAKVSPATFIIRYFSPPRCP